MADLAVWQRTIVDEEGNVIPGAEVEVRREEDGSLATLYADRAGETPLSNPLAADMSGFVRFFAQGDAYTITAVGAGSTRTWRFDPTGRLQEFDRVSEALNADGGADIVSARANLGTFSSVSEVQNSHIPAVLESIRAEGFYSPGDGGGAPYIRRAEEPLYFPKIQDVSGAWFEAERKTPLVSLYKFGAKGDGETNDTVAIQRALESGEDIFVPAGHFLIDQLIWPSRDGQRIQGAGKYRSIIQNVYNDQPLFITGDPTKADGGLDYITLRDLALLGHPNLDHLTLWGIFIPSADEHEGVSTSDNNYYKGSYDFSVDWTSSSRNALIENVTIRNVYGGYSAHISSWCNKFRSVNLWSGRGGIRNSGDANANGFHGLYISSISGIAIHHPDIPNSNPTATVYSDLVVQQSGGYEPDSEAIRFEKGQATSVRGLYLERNNERAMDTHIVVRPAEIGLRLDGLRVRDDVPGATIIRNAGKGTSIGTVVAAGPASGSYKTVVHHDGSDSRASTTVLGPISGVGNIEPNTQDGPITRSGSQSFNLYVISPDTGEGYGLSGLGEGLYRMSPRVVLRGGAGTNWTVDLESTGGMRFATDINDGTTGGHFEWFTNGPEDEGNLLLFLHANGDLRPGSDNAQPLGGASFRWSQVFAGTGTINTSDEREKQEIGSIPDAVLDAWGDVNWCQFRFNEAVERKGDGARVHFGLIAQHVQQVFESHGLDACKYGPLCYDEWEDEWDEWDDEYKTITHEDGTTEAVLIRPAGRRLVTPAGNRYGIRYDEALALEAAWQRREIGRLKEKMRE